MGKVNRGYLGAFLALLFLLLAGVSIAKGGLYIGKHEADHVHILQIVFREVLGQWPHLDFQTPIGVLATAPIALFVWLGAGAGHAFLYAQTLVALIMLPAIWWVSASRFPGRWAYLFGGFTLVLVLALVHGETGPGMSFSMYYNRWTWAMAYLAIAVAMLPGDGSRRAATRDGLIVGLALAAMALIKVTYFVAFIGPIAVMLIGRQAWRSVVVGVLSGVVVAALVTLAVGTPNFWLAYLHDLAVVAGSEVRPQPGESFAVIASAPAYLGGTLVLLLGVVFLRQAHRNLEGLAMLLLAPGFIYVTYQNYGNDPQWLPLFGFIILFLRPTDEVRNGLGWELRQGLGIISIMSFAFALPSAINLMTSPFRHLGQDEADYTQMLPASDWAGDIWGDAKRLIRMNVRLAYDTAGTPFDGYGDPDLRRDRAAWRGEMLPDCQVPIGTRTWFIGIADDLKASGLVEGKSIFTADVLSSFWLYGAGEPLEAAAPWYYGGLPGIENADFLLVPQCALNNIVRDMILNDVAQAHVELTEVRRNDMYLLYEIKDANPSYATE